jgi:hypothetical protein
VRVGFTEVGELASSGPGPGRIDSVCWLLVPLTLGIVGPMNNLKGGEGNGNSIW